MNAYIRPTGPNDVAKLFLEDAEFMSSCYVYEDIVIRGFICIIYREIKKLYVDSFAIAFYNQFDFADEREQAIEVGTTEYLVHLFQ